MTDRPHRPFVGWLVSTVSIWPRLPEPATPDASRSPTFASSSSPAAQMQRRRPLSRGAGDHAAGLDGSGSVGRPGSFARRDGRLAQAGLADAQGDRDADDQVAPGARGLHGHRGRHVGRGGAARPNKGQYQAQEGISLTYDAFVAKATVEALKRHADFNATYTEDGHMLRQAINLGIAVAVEDGLVVPVIQDADRLSIHGLNRALRDLADRARGNKLTLDDIQGGTFTLDNTGWTGSIITQPIINAPQVGILTMESIVQATRRRGDAKW